jgi:hypothetical protein
MCLYSLQILKIPQVVVVIIMTTEEISPRRLVWLQLGDNCMFCPDPNGESYTTYVALEAKLGYISCANCKEEMKEAVEFWGKHRAYGQAHHLKDRTDLKIKRSNGDIESGWRLNNPLVNVEYDGQITIHCYNESKDLGKWCYMDSVLELNE